jgi:hypothetical protein
MPAIHALFMAKPKDVDGRGKPGHDKNHFNFFIAASATASAVMPNFL